NDENAQGPYATSGMIGGPANNVVYPMWYYWNTFVNRLADYQPDTVLSETSQAYIYRLKYRAQPAKKAYVVFAPSINGSIIKNFSLNLPAAAAHRFTLVRLNDTSTTGKPENVQLTNHQLHFNLTESPVIILPD
ncbi:MAG TPA: hypothetical protein VL307_12870, partial [Chitinophagaceae bacterium]|nr:hypothetical protein [Chitinophagaceae bacterium]